MLAVLQEFTSFFCPFLFLPPFSLVISSITMLLTSFWKGLLSFPFWELFGAPWSKSETFLQIYPGYGAWCAVSKCIYLYFSVFLLSRQIIANSPFKYKNKCHQWLHLCCLSLYWWNLKQQLHLHKGILMFLRFMQNRRQAENVGQENKVSNNCKKSHVKAEWRLDELYELEPLKGFYH